MKRDNFRLYRWLGLCVSVWRPCRLYANIYISVGCFSVSVRVFVSARAWFASLYYFMKRHLVQNKRLYGHKMLSIPRKSIIMLVRNECRVFVSHRVRVFVCLWWSSFELLGVGEVWQVDTNCERIGAGRGEGSWLIGLLKWRRWNGIETLAQGMTEGGNWTNEVVYVSLKRMACAVWPTTGDGILKCNTLDTYWP